MEPGADLGPLVTRDAKKRVEELIAKGEEEGAKVVLDGRGLVVPGYENGNFVGPTIIHHVKVSLFDLQVIKLFLKGKGKRGFV